MRFNTFVTALAVPFLATAAHAQTATFDVYDSAGLTAAIAAAPSGARIQLNGGSYGDVALTNKRYAEKLTIVSVGSVRAKLSSLYLSGSSNIVVSGVDVSGTKRAVVSLGSGSSDITLTGLRIYGANINQDPWDDSNTGMHVRNVSRVTIHNTLFQDLRSGMYIQRSSGVVVQDNIFRMIREGINVAAATDLKLVGNYFHSFKPRYDLGEHPDNIQFWTSRETTGSSNVVIARNVMLNGGKFAIQGIFIRSETEFQDIPQIKHRDFQIYENIYYGSSIHGLTVHSVDNAVIRNNVVVASPWADQNGGVRTEDGLQSKGYQPGIRARYGSNNVMRNNIGMVKPGTDAGSVQHDNVDIWDTKEKRGVSWESVFGPRPTADVPPVSSFITKPGSPAANSGMGVTTLPASKAYSMK